MWFSAVKLALNAGTHIYKKKQETKMRMADAQAAHAEKMAKGELEYSGKLLEARQSDWKDEFVLVVLTLPILVIAYGVFSEDPAASEKIKEFFEQFQQLPSWFTNLWILVVASIYGIKGTQIFKNNKKYLMSDIDLINEYKDQVRILKQEVAELQDAGKSKDSANKRCLQKLEHSQQDLLDANKKITELEDQLKKVKDKE